MLEYLTAATVPLHQWLFAPSWIGTANVMPLPGQDHSVLPCKLMSILARGRCAGR